MWIAGLAGGRRRSEQPPSKDLFHHFFNQVQLHSDFVPKLRGVFNPTFLVKLPFFGNMTGKLCHQLLGMPRNGRERELPLTFVFHFYLLSAGNAALPPITYVQHSSFSTSFSSTSSFSSINSISHHNPRSLDRVRPVPQMQSTASDQPPLWNQLVTVFLYFVVFCICTVDHNLIQRM